MANFIAMRRKGAVARRVFASFALSTMAFVVADNVSCYNTSALASDGPVPVVRVLEDEIEIRYGPPLE